MSAPARRQHGFSLVELAIVVAIVGILLSALLLPLGSTVEQARHSRARADLEDIRRALLGYAASRPLPHLPCPDCRGPACAGPGNLANDGVEDRAAGGASCDAGSTVGNLPWVTLGVGDSDPWASRYSYRVAPAYADGQSGFDLDTGVAGTADVVTRNAAGARITLAANVPAVFFSHGPNQRGAMGSNGVQQPLPNAAVAADERDNLDDADDRFVSQAPRAAAAAGPGGSFDDQLYWVNSYELKAFLIQSGRLP